MISVIIDGNYLFHKTFGVFSGFGSKEPGEVLSKEGDRNIFMRKIITDLCYSLNQIPINGHVVFVKDSRSWRKDLKVERAEYKGSRKEKLDKKVDWGSFFDLIEEFGQFLELNGYTYSKAAGAEGDDLLWFWNKKLKEMGSNVVIFSGDKDSHQLVDKGPEAWTICWNANSKNNKIVAETGWTEEYLNKEKEVSIFDVTFDSESDQDKIKKLLGSVVLEEINPEKLIFEKILTGDDKDDVPSVWAYEKTPGRMFKLTASKANDIHTHYKASGWGSKDLSEIWDSTEFREWISGFILRTMNSIDSKENRALATSNYHENAQLVWLDSRVIPEHVIETMSQSFHNKNMEGREICLDRKTLISRSPWAQELTPSNFDPFNYKR
jgi:hypothetical protein